MITRLSGKQNRRDDQMIVSKDSKATYSIHYGRTRFTRLRARIYTFLDHPRYQKNYKFYLPAVLYHVFLYATLCMCGLVMELPDDTWLRAFAAHKWGFTIFDIRLYAQVIGSIGSFLLVAEYALRVWSCVANSKYGGDHKVVDPLKIRENYKKGRIRYILEIMNILELIITVITAMAYFIWTPHPHFRYVIFMRAIHWDKSVHAVTLIKDILTRGYRYIVPCWGFAFILMALHSCAVHQCEMYYRLPNDTVAESDINNLGDALWFTYVSSMSIGYGDFTPKTGLCRTISIVFSYCSNGLLFSVQTAVSLFLVKHIADEANARQDKKVQNLAAKVIQAWARFHLARRKSPASDKFTEACCQKLYHAKQKIDQQRRIAGMMLPAKRLIKRARRSSLSRQRSLGAGANSSGSSTPITSPLAAGASPALQSALARKRGSLPNHLHGLFSMTVATAGVFGSNRQQSDSPEMSPLVEDYSVENQNTVDERFLRMHKDRSGVSTISSRTKTTREEFGPLVIMIQFLLFGHFKRRFRKTEFRQPPEKKVQDEQEKLAKEVKEVERKFEMLVKTSESRERDDSYLEALFTKLTRTVEHIEEKVRITEEQQNRVMEGKRSGNAHPESDLRKRKMTVAAGWQHVNEKESEEGTIKRKHTII